MKNQTLNLNSKVFEQMQETRSMFKEFRRANMKKVVLAKLLALIPTLIVLIAFFYLISIGAINKIVNTIYSINSEGLSYIVIVILLALIILVIGIPLNYLWSREHTVKIDDPIVAKIIQHCKSVMDKETAEKIELLDTLTFSLSLFTDYADTITIRKWRNQDDQRLLFLSIDQSGDIIFNEYPKTHEETKVFSLRKSLEEELSKLTGFSEFNFTGSNTIVGWNRFEYKNRKYFSLC
jgi:hypothetical protein